MARGKGEGSVSFDKSKNIWRARVELAPKWDDEKGKWQRQHAYASSKDKKIAMQKLRKLQKDADLGVLTKKSATVEAWITKWLDEIAPERYAPKTMRSYRSALTVHITPRWGSKPLTYLTPGRLRERIQEVSKERSPGMARNLHIPLSACLKDAVNDGYLEAHPMANLTAPKRAKRVENALNVDQAVKLLRWLARQMDEDTEWTPLAPLFIAYLLTGARRSELLGLRPEYVVGESLDVEWQLQRVTTSEIESLSADREYESLEVSNFHLMRPKYGSTRSYPLVEPLKTVIDSLVESTPAGKLLFRTAEGLPWDPDAITSKWADLMHASKIENHDTCPDNYENCEDGHTPPSARITLHGTRHTVVDLLYILEVPEHVIIEITGHSDVKTARGYRTRQSPAVKEAMESVAKLLQAGE